MAIPLSPETEARLRAEAARQGKDPGALADALLLSVLPAPESDGGERTIYGMTLAEARALLSGPARPEAEVARELDQKYQLSDLSHLSDEELAEDAERIVAGMDPAIRAEMERQGLL
jgi:hypothetical protein